MRVCRLPMEIQYKIAWLCASPGIEFKEMLRWKTVRQDWGPEVPIHTSGFLSNCHVRGKHGKNQGFRRKDPWISTLGSPPFGRASLTRNGVQGIDHRRISPEPKIPIGSLCIDDCSMRNSFNALNILVTLVPTHIYVRRPESSTCN